MDTTKPVLGTLSSYNQISIVTHTLGNALDLPKSLKLPINSPLATINLEEAKSLPTQN